MASQVESLRNKYYAVRRVLNRLNFTQRRSIAWLVAAALLSAVVAPLALAQTVSPDLLNSLSPEMLRALQQGQGSTGLGSDGSTIRPDVQSYPPIVLRKDQAPPSRLEELYLQRSGEYLKQFGYDSLGVPSTVSISQSGALPDQYVLSSSDELVITFRGQENSTFRVRVDRDGTVTLPKMTPILAAGRQFGEFRADVEAQVAQAFVATKVFVTLGSVHQMSILVSGEVRAPGSRVVSGLASPLDVILLSGGIKKTGSLRAVKIVGRGGSHIVDLYSVVAQGRSSNLGTLHDGDTIYVPPVGATAAVAGAVSRPGIFELPAGTNGFAAASLLRLAGGVEIAGSYTLAKISIQSNGGLSLLPARPGDLVRSGEVLVVVTSRGATAGQVSLRGAVSSPGLHPISSSPTAGDLFHSAADLSYDGYAPFALILRRDAITNAVTIIPFSIAGAIRRTNNVALQSEDLVYVMTRAQVASMARLVTKNVNEAYTPRGMQAGGNAPGQAPNAAVMVQPGSAGTTPTGQGGFQTPPLGNVYVLPPAPSAGRESPPGIEPPADQTTRSPFPAAPNLVQPYPGPGGSIPNATNPNPYDPNAYNPNAYSSNSYSPNIYGSGASGLYQDDPRFSGAGQSNSAEAAALVQAQVLATRNSRANGSLVQSAWPDEVVVAQLANLLHVTNNALLRAASDNLVWVLDDVREPGAYVGAPGSSVQDMIQAAGGVQQTADLSSIEVTSTEVDQRSGMTRTSRSNYALPDSRTAMVSVRPLDVIRLRPVFSDREEGTVTVAGQVRFPGVFDITRSERLSSLLRRAGGLSEVAYPYGAIYTRKDAAIAEKEANERSARELEGEIPTLILNPSSQGQQLASLGPYLTSLTQNLRTMPVLGRIVITADPAVLAAKPDLDIVLQPGDTLFIPKRPSTVTVAGEVLNPGAFQYRSSLRYSDYIKLAGGVTQSADDSRTFIVYPNGSSAPIDTDWLSFDGGANIPPGSTVVVPRDLRPFNWSTFLKDATQIASQLAVTAASLSVLNNN